MTNSNKKKKEQLGMSFGTACHRLRKSIMFELVKRLEIDNCFRCGLKMNLDNFSIEHKTPWLHAEKPLDLFFDLENISFSHLKCNYESRRIPRKYSKEEAIVVSRQQNAKWMREHYTPEKRREKKLLTGY